MISTADQLSGKGCAREGWSTLDLVLFVSLLVVAIAHRMSTLGPLIYWPDTIGYWTQARQISEGLAYSTEFHRASRLGVVLPLALFQRLAGTTVAEFYLFSALQSIAQVALVFLVARIYAGPWCATLAGALFLGWSLEDFDGSYITADGVAGVWVGLSFYLMALYSVRGKGAAYAYLSAMALACAYLTKITSAFFIPGLLLMWLRRNPRWYRDRWAVCFLALATASFIAVERILLVLVTGAGHSVLSLTERTYGRSGKLKPLSLGEFLLRPLELPTEQFVWFACAISLCVIFLSWKALRARSESLLLVASTLFLLALFYTPRSLVPLTPAALIRPRYYSAVLPILSVAIVVGVRAALGCLPLQHHFHRSGRIFALAVLSYVGSISLLRVPTGVQTFQNVLLTASTTAEAYQRGETIFAKRNRAGKYLLNATRWLLIPGPGEPPSMREEEAVYVVRRPDSLPSEPQRCLHIVGAVKERARRNKLNQLVKVAELPSSGKTYLRSEYVGPERCP